MACNAEDAGRCRRGRAGCAGGLYVCYAFQVHHLHTPRSRPAFAAKPVHAARAARTDATHAHAKQTHFTRALEAVDGVEEGRLLRCLKLRGKYAQMKSHPQVSTSPSDANDVNDRKYGLGRVLRTRWRRDSAMEPWRSSPCGRAAASEISAEMCYKKCYIVTLFVTYIGNRAWVVRCAALVWRRAACQWTKLEQRSQMSVKARQLASAQREPST